MAASRVSRCLLVVSVIWLSLVSGCADGGYIVKARFGSHEVVARSSSANVIGVRTGDRQAEVFLDSRTITVNPSQVLWGKDHHITLPARWKYLELVESGRRVIVNVDGEPLGEIAPAI